jgi:deoxyribose-phosphate aldolase
MDRAQLARMIDHTLLKPEATPGQVAMLCTEAADLGVAAVCVSPSRLPLPVPVPAGVATCVVIGFPSGAHHSTIKAAEAARAEADGATEVDMVIDLGSARAGLWDEVEKDIAAVRAAITDAVLLKVIIESSALDHPDGIVAACRAAEAAGAQFVKTSTGFHPSGGATTEAVALMAETVSGRLGVKASGGIRDLATALAMVEAGATRLGCSGTRAILDELTAQT